MKQVVKKGAGIKKKDLAVFKEKLGLGSVADKTLEKSNADKPMDWLIMPKAYQEALRLPGIPLNYVTTILGHSETGKSTLVNHAIVAAQRMGLVPVIYDTENHFDFRYAMNMGMEAEPIWGDVEVVDVDEETGEETVHTENRIVRYEGDFIYFNNTLLASAYGDNDYSTGKQTKTKRKDAVIEDIAFSVNRLLDAQDEGELDRGFVFIWDSVGSIDCYKSLKSGSGNAMWNAAAISQCFNNILNNRIPRSRKASSDFDNAFIFVNKVWKDSMSNPMPGAPPTLQQKGGNAIHYATRLEIRLGGIISAGTKRLKATSKGFDYKYGLESKICCTKNELPSPYTVTYDGTVYCTPYGLVAKDELETFKKTKISDILKSLTELSKSFGKDETFTADDIEFTEEEVED